MRNRMIDFEKEFGFPLTWKLEAKFHRFNINKKCQGYNGYALMPHKYAGKPLINFSNICKHCLNTFSTRQIEDLKFWLIIRRLKN